ncbi:arabinosyltransferase domain-containing protein [Nocardia sp. NPDC088792]|uniref:arabinosyltransferase domain-containing protein n=1 Tax=Nocardia sp. NPDC088792 TaxID=3364332 RepID=UPI00380E6A0F
MTLLLSRRKPSDDQPADSSVRQPESARLWRLIAILAGILGALLAVAVPFLPVQQQQASYSWPQHGQATSLTSPLVSYSPVSLDVNIPCTAITGLGDKGGNLLSTVPPNSGQAWHYGLNVVVAAADSGPRLRVVLRDKTLLDTPVSSLPAGCGLAIASDGTRTTVDAAGSAPIALDGDFRPQVVGLFTDLKGAAPNGMTADVTIDSRFTTGPSALKLVAIIGTFLAAALALFALHRLDCLDGRRNRRVLPRRWWRPRWVDGVVVGVLVLWYFIGAGTADDGYIFGMARTAGHAGYLANYFAYFGVPETPIGIPYDSTFELFSRLSTASIVVRLPELIFGILCWLLISREVVPRLGMAARRQQAAIWAGGLVFLSFWLPYNNGLRPEPAVALGVLLTWVSMERALATKRLAPAALALVPAALAVVANPEGLICFAALLAGARPLVQIIVERARKVGYLALVAPAAAAGLAILAIVFAGQPFAEVSAMRQAHKVVGPDMPWYDESLVYQDLFQPTPDGSMARRFAMLVMFLALAVSVLALLRRNGRIPGLAGGPTRRIIGTTIAAIPLMALSPTKFTHHLGVFAGLAGAVTVVAAVAAGPAVLRSARNRALFAAAALAVLAVSFSSSNGWWYVASYRVSWWDKPISVHGIGAGTVLLALAVLMVGVAGWLHIREPFRGKETAPRRTIPVLTIAAAFVVLFEVLSFVKAGVEQYPAYSLAKGNFRALTGNTCGLANDVLVEPDPNAGLLQPLSGDPATALGATGTGFTPDGINYNDLTPDASDTASASVGQSLGSAGTTTKAGTTSTGGTADTTVPHGINGSTIPLPFGLNPATTPVLGSYGSPGAQKTLVSGWYKLPARDAQHSIISIAAAGRIASTDIDNLPVPGQSVQIEYGVAGGADAQALGRVTPDDVSELQPSWRNLRVPLQQLPPQADVVRIVATVDSSDPLQWIALTPPRVPQLQTLDALVGHTTPVLLDWLVGLQFPCQQPMQHRYGVADVPKYRILPDLSGSVMTSNWESHASGGPLGYTDLVTRSEVMPSYLKDDWKRNWGEIERLVPLDPTATAARLDVSTERRSGLWTPGPLNFGIR